MEDMEITKFDEFGDPIIHDSIEETTFNTLPYAVTYSSDMVDGSACRFMTDDVIRNLYEHNDMAHKEPICTFFRVDGDLYGRYADKDVRITYRNGNTLLNLFTELKKGDALC